MSQPSVVGSNGSSSGAGKAMSDLSAELSAAGDAIMEQKGISLSSTDVEADERLG